jgi:hypothetical protein
LNGSLPTTRGIRVSPSIGAAIALVIHIIVAVVLFLLIGAAAVLLSVATTWCEERNLTQPWVVQGMNALEMFLWATDALCLVLFVVSEAIRFGIRVVRPGGPLNG